MRDSDLCGDTSRLAGVASLSGGLGRFIPIAAVLPAYPDLAYRRAVHADPARALSRRWLFSLLLPATFTQRQGVRLFSGC